MNYHSNLSTVILPHKFLFFFTYKILLDGAAALKYICAEKQMNVRYICFTEICELRNKRAFLNRYKVLQNYVLS